MENMSHGNLFFHQRSSRNVQTTVTVNSIQPTGIPLGEVYAHIQQVFSMIVDFQMLPVGLEGDTFSLTVQE